MKLSKDRFTHGIALAVLLLGGSGGLLAAQEKTPPEARSAPSEEKENRARQILAAAAEAAGGGALKEVESAELTVRSQTPTTRGPMEMESLYWVGYPDHLRVERWLLQSWVKGHSAPSGSGPVTPMQMEDARTQICTEGYDGKAGWLLMSFGNSELPMDARVLLRIDLIGAIGLYRSALEGQLKARLADEEPLEGRMVQAVDLITLGGAMRFVDFEFQATPDGDRVVATTVDVPAESLRLYFDPQTHLLVGTRFRGLTDKGARDIVQTWSDYRAVSFKREGKKQSMQVPFTWVTYQEGKRYHEEKLKRIKLNTQPAAKLFARP